MIIHQTTAAAWSLVCFFYSHITLLTILLQTIKYDYDSDHNYYLDMSHTTTITNNLTPPTPTLPYPPMLTFPFTISITTISRWYDICQGPWPALFDFVLLGTDHWPVREKVFKLLRQTAITYAWAVCIQIPRNSNLMKRKLVSEWDMISASAFSTTGCGGEDTGNHFIGI